MEAASKQTLGAGVTHKKKHAPYPWKKRINKKKAKATKKIYYFWPRGTGCTWAVWGRCPRRPRSPRHAAEAAPVSRTSPCSWWLSGRCPRRRLSSCLWLPPGSWAHIHKQKRSVRFQQKYSKDIFTLIIIFCKHKNIKKL